VPLVVSTDSVALKDQQEYWRSVLAEMYYGVMSVMPAPRSDGYDSYMERLMFGDLVVDRLRAEASRVERTARLTRTSPNEAMQLTVLSAGRALVSQDGRTAVLASPGDLVFVDTSRPFVYQFDARTEQVCIQVPRARLIERMPALTDLTAVIVPGRTGLGAIAASADRAP
jgi:hypothetical protein